GLTRAGVIGVIGAIVLTIAPIAACTSKDSCVYSATCFDLDAGTRDFPDAATPPDCDPAADAISPAATGCVVDTFALFVDAENGDDANDGFKDKPLRSVGAAVAKVPSTGKRRIYICGSATYP